MVAVVVRELRERRVRGRRPGWAKIFAVAVVVVMTSLNIVGSTSSRASQSPSSSSSSGSSALFSVVTIANINPQLLAPSGYPPLRDIVSSVALTFFAFLGFGVVTFTAKDLRDPARQLPRAMTIAIGLATVVYVAVSLGVFGTLTVSRSSTPAPTAIAVAAEPVLGDAGYWLMSLTALFATAGATNAGLYPAPGFCDHLAATRQFPPVMGREVAGRRPLGLPRLAVRDRRSWSASTCPRSLRSAARSRSPIFCLVTDRPPAHPRRHRRDVACSCSPSRRPAIALLAFVFTTLIQEPASIATLVAILVISIVLDLAFSRPHPDAVA